MDQRPLLHVMDTWITVLSILWLLCVSHAHSKRDKYEDTYTRLEEHPQPHPDAYRQYQPHQRSNLHAMDLHGHPNFLPTKTLYAAQVGDSVVLECTVINLHGKKVIWRKSPDPNPLTVGKDPFYNDGRHMIQEHNDLQKWNLVIKDVRVKDAGSYECQVSSKLKYLRHMVHLVITEKEDITAVPRPGITISGTTYVDKDAIIMLVCEATGLEYAPDALDWFVNGNKIRDQDNSRIAISKWVSISDRTIRSQLIINDAQVKDSGKYVCRTSNLQVMGHDVQVLNANSSNWKRGTVTGNNQRPGSGYVPPKDGKGPPSGNGEGGAWRGERSHHQNSSPSSFVFNSRRKQSSLGSWCRSQFYTLSFYLAAVSSVVICSLRYSIFPS